MGSGYLRVETRTANNALPVVGAVIIISSGTSPSIYQLTSDQGGLSGSVPLYAPDKAVTLSPGGTGPFYQLYNVEISHPDFLTAYVRGVQVFDTIESVLTAVMLPAFATAQQQGVVSTYALPPNTLLNRINWSQTGPPPDPYAQRDVIVPEKITVHLSVPSSAARNVMLDFHRYIKNVCAGMFFPTWPEEALEANVRVVINFALNRVYTRWYRGRGDKFDITSSPSYDMAFAEGRNTFTNVDRLVDRCIGWYLRMQGYREPYFTPFCSGSYTTCDGLSQWGTVTLANQGYSALEILRAYYTETLELAHVNGIEAVSERYPGQPLNTGMRGSSAELIQRCLNRIGANYSQIPSVQPTGIYDEATADAVAAFQRLFNLPVTGVVDEATWNRIFGVNADVIRLYELYLEGLRTEIDQNPNVILRIGSEGSEVTLLQFLLNYASAFFNAPIVSQGDVYDADTAAAVDSFQRRFNLSPTGIVGPADWDILYGLFGDLQNITIPTLPDVPEASDYPGRPLTFGSQGDDVIRIQSELNQISNYYPVIPRLPLDGYYGELTQEAVRQFQRQFGLSERGVVNYLTWNKLNEVHNQVSSFVAVLPEYPDIPLRPGARGEDVLFMQHYLNDIATRYPEIPTSAEDGIFSPMTQEAVMVFQRLFNLPQSGEIDSDTWNAILDEWLEYQGNAAN